MCCVQCSNGATLVVVFIIPTTLRISESLLHDAIGEQVQVEVVLRVPHIL